MVVALLMNTLQKTILRAIEWRRAEAEAGNRWVVWGIPVACITLIFLLLWLFAKWANANSGFVTALSVFLSVPLAVITANKLEHRRIKRKVKITLHILTHELWCNLNYVRQIERSYQKNIDRLQAGFESETKSKDAGGIGLPHIGPRLSVIEKFIGEEHVFNLNPPLPTLLTEVYAQLSELRTEFPRWKDMVLTSSFPNIDTYILLSSTMMNIIAPLMRNMLKVWVSVVSEVGMYSEHPQVVQVAAKINDNVKNNEHVIIEYRSSVAKESNKPIPPDWVIICWENDWSDCPIQVIELRHIAILHPTWAEC